MKRFYLSIGILVFFIGCAERQTPVYHTSSTKSSPYVIDGKMYYPLKKVNIGYTQMGIASWYGPNFHGKYTSNGEVYNMFAYTAAHKTLPMNTIVKVTNLDNGKSVIVRINDRGPFVKGRIIDLSYVAGKKIGLDKSGTAPVKLEVIGFGKRVSKYINKSGSYFIQVGAFFRKSGAKSLANKYKKFRYNTFITRQNGFYKVYIGKFKNYTEAKRFQLKHKIAGFIVGEIND